MKRLINRLLLEKQLKPEEYLRLLTAESVDVLKYINHAAREVSVSRFGKAIYTRGLIEITNHCHNNCYYCGIRRDNKKLERYRLSKHQILECCETGYRLGIKTFVLQGGEDGRMDANFIEDLVSTIHSRFPEHAITLSLGEHTEELYKKFFHAGANRYLLRHETANAVHYAHLHPPEMSYQKRIRCLDALKKTGYETGAGMMTGSPGQRPEHLVEDILFLQALRPEMIGIGPFLPQKDSPFAGEPAGSVEITLMMISILRLLFPNAWIPATTALATLTHGYERGILAGANVVMPNLTPAGFREKYAIYDNKKASCLSCTKEYNELKEQINDIGYFLC